ncbi:MAG TPA: LLM class flavin-dependent oxidoreductase [Solirubrobacterales bacterium]
MEPNTALSEPMSGDDLRAWREANVPLYNEQKLKLGLFGTNCSYGLTMTEAETSYEVTWPHTIEIARRADRMGFELLVPIARWRGFGGSTDFNGENYETYTWAAGVAAQTENIMTFATSHLPTVHPIVAAKAATTVDHISNGRAGLNVVMGWFNPEMEMFGAEQREHDERYDYGSEWLDIANRLWAGGEPFDYEGKFLRVKAARAAPLPIQRPRPVLVNAGSSKAGTDFAAREVDFNFLSIDTIENAANMAANVRKIAAGYGRDIGVLGYAYVICRDTEEEAKRHHEYIIEKGDWDGAKNIIDVMMTGANQSFETQIRTMQERFIAGWGGYPVIGTPEQVVEELGRISAAGIDGLTLGFLDYNEELKYFDDAVMPLMREAGLRS